MMRAGAEDRVRGHHQDGWFTLQLNVPGGTGWVAADHLNLR